VTKTEKTKKMVCGRLSAQILESWFIERIVLNDASTAREKGNIAFLCSHSI
jgi:hypothetical protein